MSDGRNPMSDLHDEFNPKKLDVIAAIREAYTGAWNHGGEMLRLIWLPGVLYIALNIVGSMLVGNDILRLLIEIATLSLWAIIAVAWYRFILIGETPTGTYQINFGIREMRFLATTFLLVLLALPGLIFAGPPEFPPAAYMAETLKEMGSSGSLVGFFGLLLSFIGFYFLFRLLLLFPAVATDETLNVRLILERTRGNFWRILALCILSSLPMFLAIILAATLPLVIAVFLQPLLLIFFAIVNVAILSIAYRELIGPPGAMTADIDRPDMP